MLRATIRIMFGYALACLAGGLTLVLHVISPAALIAAPGDALADKLTELGTLATLSATHLAVFSLPFALIVAAVAEWFALRGWLYFVLGGLAIAGTGFLAQQAGETASGPSIVNAFAIQAFVLTGITGGLVYWLVSGRYSGGEAATDWETLSAPPPRARSDREPASPEKPGTSEA